MRRLLEVDKFVPERSDEEIRQEQHRNFRWNFSVNFLDGALFFLGYSFISATTILPLFVSKLTSNPMPIAFVAIIGQASWYLPQLLSAGPTEKLARKKPVVVNLGLFIERLPLWLLPIAALLAIEYPMLSLALFLIGFATHGLGAGMVAPAWTDMVAQVFPVTKRGRSFGITAFAGTGLGAFGALLSGWLLATYPFPLNFAYAFLLAAIFILLSWVALAFMREPVQPVSEKIKRQKSQSWQKITGIVRGDKNFRNYLIVRLMSSLGNMATGFITVSAILRWSVPDATVGLYTAALLIGQTVGNLMAGFVADHVGHKLSMEIGLLSMVIAYAIALLAPTSIWFFLVFFMVGVGSGIAIVSGILINLEFSRPEYRPTYVGIANTTMGIGSVAGPLIGGLLALRGYNLLFIFSALFAIAGLILLATTVHEPRDQTEFFDASVAEAGEG